MPESNHPTERNITSVANALEDPQMQGLSRGERIGQLVAGWAGSLPSLLLHVVLVASWISANRAVVRSPSDPLSYSGLATLLSVEAIILTLFILMNQAAMARQAQRRSHLDLQVNLLTEQETTTSLAILRRLCEHLQVDIRDLDVRHDLSNLAEKTDVEELMGAVDTRL